MDIARQSYLLSPGDHFFVPQLTMYAMSNHSVDTEAEVAFVVIKPGVGAASGVAPAAAGGGGAYPPPGAPGASEAGGGEAEEGADDGGGRGAALQQSPAVSALSPSTR